MATGLSLSELPLVLSRPQSEWGQELEAGLRLPGDVLIPVTAQARTDELVQLRSTSAFPPTPLPGLAGLLSSEEAALLAPPALGGVERLLLVELVLDYDRAAQRIQGLNLICGYPVQWDIGAEWLGRPGQLVVDGLRASVDMIDFLAGNTEELSVYGQLRLPGAARLNVGLSLPSLELWAMLDDQTPLRLRDIVALFDFNELPDGLRDLSLSMLTMRAAPLSKSGEVAACVRDVWQLQIAERSFALSELFFRLGYTAGRGFFGSLAGTLRLAGVPLTLSADHDPGEGWTFLGMLAGKRAGLAGNTLKLRALLSELINQDTLPPEVPDIEFTELSLSVTPGTGALSLSCAASLDLALGDSEIKIQSAALHVDRTPGGNVQVTLSLECSADIADTLQIERSTLEFQLDTGSRTWSLSGGFKATLFKQQPALDLQASLHHGPTGTQIRFDAEGAEVGFELLSSPQVHAYLGFRSFTLDRMETGTRLSVAVRARLSGLPSPLDSCLPQQLDLVGSFASRTLSLALAATFGIDIPLPSIELRDSSLRLGTMRLELRNIALQLGSKPSLGATVAIGLPSELNKLFGTEADGSASVNVFRTYQPGLPDSLIGLSLKLDSEGLSAQILSPPLSCITGQGQSWSLDLGEFGAISLTVPTISASGTSLSGSGSLQIDGQRGLHLPLTPIRALFEQAGLTDAAQALPRSLRLDRIQLLDSSGEVDLAGMLGIERTALPAEVQSVLATINQLTTRLPERLRSYLSFEIRSLSFDLSTDAAGNISLNIATAKNAPLRCLLPGFPFITGITLRRLSFGPVLGGSLFKLDIDADIDLFDFATLVMTQAMPDEWFGEERSATLPPNEQSAEAQSAPLPPREAIQRTLHLNNLLAFIVYQAGVPIPLPLLYTKLGYTYVGVEGFESELHLFCHAPKAATAEKFSFDVGEALRLVQSLKRFFLESDYLLSAQSPPESLNLVCRVDKAHLTLPRYLGGMKMGTSEPVEVFNVYKTLAGTLDTIKTGSPRYILQTVPVERRTGSFRMNLLDIASADVGWALVSREEIARNRGPVVSLLSGGEGRVAVPASDVQAIIPSPAAIVGADRPTQATDPDEVLAVMRGGFSLGGLGLDSLCVMRASPSSGFATALRLRSQLGQAVSFELRGLLQAGKRGSQPMLLAGTSQMTVGERTVMYGGFALSNQQLQVEGLFDFFPADAPVKLRGQLAGSINSQGLRLAGHGELVLFGLPLVGASLDMQLAGADYAVNVSTTLLGATANFQLSVGPSEVRAFGSLSPIRVGSLLMVGRAANDLDHGPSFSLVSNRAGTACQIRGYASLLDLINVQADIDLGPSGSQFSFSSSALGAQTHFNCLLPQSGGLTLTADFSTGVSGQYTVTKVLADGRTEQVTSPALSLGVTGGLRLLALPPPTPESLTGPWRTLEAQQAILFAPTCPLRGTSADAKLGALEEALWRVHEWHLALTTGRVPVLGLNQYRAAVEEALAAADDLAAAIASLTQARPSQSPLWHELAVCLAGVRSAAQRGVETSQTALQIEGQLQPQLDDLVRTLSNEVLQPHGARSFLQAAQALRDLLAARSLYPDDPTRGGAGCSLFADAQTAAYLELLDQVIATMPELARTLQHPYSDEPARLQAQLQTLRSRIPASESVGYRLPRLDALADAQGHVLARLQARFGSQAIAQALAARGHVEAAAAVTEVLHHQAETQAAASDLAWVLVVVDRRPDAQVVHDYVARRADYKRMETLASLSQPGAEAAPLRALLALRAVEVSMLPFLGFAVPVDDSPGQVAAPSVPPDTDSDLAVSLGMRLSFVHMGVSYDLVDVQIDGPAARKLNEIPGLIALEVAARVMNISNENLWLDRRLNRHARARLLRRHRAAEHRWALERYHGLVTPV